MNFRNPKKYPTNSKLNTPPFIIYELVQLKLGISARSEKCCSEQTLGINEEELQKECESSIKNSKRFQMNH